MTSLSHHEAPLSATATRKRQHENRCRGFSLHTKASSHAGFHARALFSSLVLLLFWSSMFSAVTAAGTDGGLPTLRVQDDLAWTGSSLYLDQRPPPIVAPLMPPVHGNEDATKTTSAALSKRSIATAAHGTDNDFQIPQPFDTSLSNNFTSSCGNFMNRLRNSQSFNNCHPFSLMLQVC